MSALALPTVVLALALGFAWVSAALLFPAWTAIARRSPWAARWTAAVSAVPVAIGLALVLSALLPGDPHANQLLGCHCHVSMPGWLHLCPVHPGSAAGMVPAAMVALALLLPGRLRAWSQLAREPLGDGSADGPVVVQLERPMALVVGWLRPTVVVDRGLWSGLTETERSAVLAHEQAHLTRRDPLVLMVLRALVSFGPPAAANAVVRAWLDRAETRADAVAARHVGDPLLVAEALIRCARLGVGSAAPAIGWTAGGIERRVQALLDHDDADSSDRPDLGLPDLAAALSLGVVGVLSTPWVHHQVEHLLNLSL